ncbi:type I-C CRISPR-associated protein Cas8c/Csd1 [Paenibacillus sp. NPDC058071]|uniref:type I-C CRISPR-associated protein Cas8c/Csd1 n=1 Tax=Paenibacillus sp. NPDC058071 TaxID=3346326 RepID=UPI0036DA2BDA
MSWLLNLYQTYESNLGSVGEIQRRYNDQEYTLLPISHTTQTAHIEVWVTEDGEFYDAKVITDKEKRNTLIPCTEDSASRAGSKIAPYPLHDKLSYVAGDFVAYGGQIKKEEPFSYYIAKLKEWAESPYATSKVISIYRYLNKRRLIQDLVARKVIALNSDNQLIDKWDKKYEALYESKPDIFSAVTGEQESAFVRFNVYSPDKVVTDVWKDRDMYDSFIRFYREQLGDEDFCFVTGESRPSTDKHANKIRNAADKAKLISANDSSGFTYRGRFNESRQAASISYDVSQKAHNALKWLINRQGKVIDQRVFLVWGNEELDVAEAGDDSYTLFPEVTVAKEAISFTNEEYARQFTKALDGYSNGLSKKGFKDAKVNILVLDSATTGRMAVLYYRNLNKEFYLEKLIKWHSTCRWLHRYRKNDEGDYLQFFGAPSTKDIAFAAYGSNANDKLVKGLIERMLPCMIDGHNIPKDIVRSAYHRARNPVAMEAWEWEKTLSIACALINQKEEIGVALDETNRDRSYLFGRLLAVADVLERRALGRDEKRATNAIRYMNVFASHPARTWETIQKSILPHQVRLGTTLTFWNKLIDEITWLIPSEDFNNKRLSEQYLLGFYSQRYALYQSKELKENEIDANEASN